MTDSTVLDEAEQRIAPAATTAKTLRQERLDAMYQEIGHQHYEQARVELPKLEHFIAKEIRPFLARVASIGQRARNPLPTQVLGWINEMGTLCDSAPTTIRAGFDKFDRLTPPIGKDGRLDPNERMRLVYHIRVCLRNWDGVQGRLAELKALTENFIGKSGWPTSAA